MVDFNGRRDICYALSSVRFKVETDVGINEWFGSFKSFWLLGSRTHYLVAHKIFVGEASVYLFDMLQYQRKAAA